MVHSLASYVDGDMLDAVNEIIFRFETIQKVLSIFYKVFYPFVMSLIL